MKKILFVFLLLSPYFTHTYELEEILVLRSKKVLDGFITAAQNDTLLTYDTMSQLFADRSMDYDQLRQAIRADFVACKRVIRKSPEHVLAVRQLLQQLRLLYKYVKQNKECCKAIHFHQKLKEDYHLAFNNPAIVQCLEMTPYLYGVGTSKYKCRAYFNKISADLRIIDRFEDRIHGDFSVLKAHNYVYKIELIKIRNHVYHHNIYKFETRYF